jgi:hypothetical protein
MFNTPRNLHVVNILENLTMLIIQGRNALNVELKIVKSAIVHGLKMVMSIPPYIIMMTTLSVVYQSTKP